MVQHLSRIIVEAASAGRADRVVQTLTGLTRSRVTALFARGGVQVNGRVCTETFTRVCAGDVVEVRRDQPGNQKPAPRPWRDKSFSVVHEDAEVIVVDKAAGVMTVPSPSHKGVSLVEAVARYLNRGDIGPRPMVVQRLDRGVSGLLVLAKTPAAGENLRAQFAGHKPRREYVALVAGLVQPEQGVFRSNLITGGNLSRRSTPDPDEGEPAVTHYHVEQTFPAQGNVPGLSRVRCRLETGKRHQIRVQFAEAGHPVLGDDRYQVDLARHPRWRAKRLALHACVLEFIHPATGKLLRFASPLPREFNIATRSA